MSSNQVDSEARGLDIPGLFYRSAAEFGLRKLPPDPAIGFWLPQRLPPLQLHLLAASRMSQRQRQNPRLLAAVMQVVQRLRDSPAALCYSAKFALAPIIRAASKLAEIPLLELRTIPANASLSWLRREKTRSVSPLTFRLYFSELLPNLDAAFPERLASPLLLAWGFRPVTSSLSPDTAIQPSKLDWLSVHLASQVHVLSLRRGGNIELAVRSRLQQREPEELSIRLLDAPDLTPPELAAELWQSGAIRWELRAPSAPRPAPAPRRTIRTNSRSGSTPILAFNDLNQRGEYLCHWTRASSTNRHPESDRLFHDLLLQSTCDLQWSQRLLSNSSHLPAPEPPWVTGPVRTLLQIVTSGRILASQRWTRGGPPAVSLTAQPLTEWHKRRVYRSHLGRWDFEPYGIGIARQAIRELGGRPVIYGDRALREKLSPDQLPWFQLAGSTKRKSNLDWTQEQEWRVLSDIDLKQFGPDIAFVFVADEAAAALLSPYSRWPIMLLPEPEA